MIKYAPSRFARPSDAVSATRSSVARLAASLQTAQGLPQNESVSETKPPPRSAYVHLPFCKRRCYYCDFPIHVLGSKETQSSANTISHYRQLLCKEIEQMPRVSQIPLETVFFGGGTPSLIPPTDLRPILEALRCRFQFAREMEISMEADPGTFDRTKLGEYLSLGVNRISLGIQSFDDEILKLCGRSHTLADVWGAVEDIQSSEVPSWSLDLISGLPNTTLESWRMTLESALSCRPDHVSIYDLQIEAMTPFHRWYKAEMPPLPSHELSAEMYSLASALLREAGYEHYEISNYARDGHRCRHNMTYWMHQPFYGFGLGATSHVNNKRRARPKKMKQYSEWVDQGSAANPSEAPMDEVDSILETLMLRLRLRDGIEFALFRSEYGKEAEEKLKQSVEDYCTQGIVECVNENGSWVKWRGSWEEAVRIRLQDPNGFLLSNEILSTIFRSFSN